MLLQLSPLLIAAPLAAVGGQVLRLHSACRKFVSALPESQRRIQYSFHLETDGFDVACGESFGHVAWNDVSKAIEKPDYFVLHQNKFQAKVVPKEGFLLHADVATLRGVLRAKLGERARLLSQ
jgi:YcxB-like protein